MRAKDAVRRWHTSFCGNLTPHANTVKPCVYRAWGSNSTSLRKKETEEWFSLSTKTGLHVILSQGRQNDAKVMRGSVRLNVKAFLKDGPAQH